MRPSLRLLDRLRAKQVQVTLVDPSGKIEVIIAESVDGAINKSELLAGLSDEARQIARKLCSDMEEKRSKEGRVASIEKAEIQLGSDKVKHIMMSGRLAGLHIYVAPGHHALKIFEFICSKKTYERVFLQNILDMRDEYFDALNGGRRRKAQWIVIRGYLGLLFAVLLHLSAGFTSKIVRALLG